MKLQKNLLKLLEIYETLPSANCQGLCVDACGIIPTSKLDRINISRNHNTGISTLLDKEKGMVCNQLNNGRCKIYDSRPLVCRLYGIVESLPCPFGCLPERILSKEEEMRIHKAVLALNPPKSTKVKF